jgi:hypothetical protein
VFIFMLRKNVTPLACALSLGLASLSLFGSITPAIAQNPPSFPDDASLVPVKNVAPSPQTVFTPSNQYIVYLANVNPTMVPQIKTVAPDSFVSHLDSGQKVLQIGRYNNLNLAQKKADQLRQMGLTPEVKPVSTKFANALPAVPSAVPVAVPRNTTPSTPSIPSSIPPTNLPPSVPTDPNTGMQTIANAQPIPIENSNVLPGVPTGLDPQQGNTVEINRSIQQLPPAQVIPVAPVPTTLPPTAAIDPNPPAPIPNQYRYFVIIPSTAYGVLQRAKLVSPNAQVKASSRGSYIEVQGYTDRPSAEALSSAMRKQGFDSRVAFF